MQTLITILIVAAAVFVAGRWVVGFVRSMYQPGKGGCGGSCGCGHGKDEKKPAVSAPRTVFIPASALGKKR